jgi:glucose/arabinose dehydrogenase
MNKALFGAALLCLGVSANAANMAASAKLYQTYCASCHGVELQGGEGPSLVDKTWLHGEPTKSNLVKIISKGVPAKGMPAWEGSLKADQIAALADYIAPKSAAARKAVKPTAEANPLAGLKLPKGFAISIYADKVDNARAMAISPSGIVYVGSRKPGKVYALIDENKDGTADKIVTVAEGLNNPQGLALLNGDLYVGEISRIIKFEDIDRTYASKPSYKVIKDDLPKETWHGEKYLKAGPDGKIYVPIGAPCNVCNKEDEPYSKLWRMNPDGSQWEEVARGIRNTVGFTWHPVTKELWFTDNGRDEMGDNTPSCELNVVTKKGQHFGFPYCHGGAVPDPEFGQGRSCSEFTPPVAKLGPHVAPLGLAFYTGTQFPQQYRNQIFIAEHGSWNRANKIGYQVRLITLYGNEMVSDTSFIDGFLQGENVIGRPVDVAVMADGSMLVSDDYANRVYRITYTGK